MESLDVRVNKAIRHFWKTRDRQARQQGSTTGRRDAGLRTAVTGGKHLDGFVVLCRELLVESGLLDAEIFWRERKELPGYFRAEKTWDLVAVSQGNLVAAVEFKAQVGPSFGNNFNNRTEEAIGNAVDLWSAYRAGAFKPSQRPWLGFVFILEECEKSLTPVTVRQSHFGVFPEFVQASYAQRYEILLTKLLRERLYDGVSLLLTPRQQNSQGTHRSPTEELGFRHFATSLSAHALAFSKLR